MMKKNKISKKINKIIPAVLLSGAMVVPVSQLTSPIVAHAYENSSATTQSSIDYTPTVTELVDAPLNVSTDRINTRSRDLLVQDNKEIIVDLTKEEFHEFDATLTVPLNDSGSVRYKVYLDDRCIRDTGNMKPGDEKDIHVEIFGDDAKELKIVTTSSSGNARSNNFGLIENGKFTTYHTNYGEKMCVKKYWEFSDPVRVSRDMAWISSSFPSYSDIYLRTNLQHTFETISDDPCLSCEEKVSVTTQKGLNIKAFGFCSAVTVGAKVKYDIEEGYRAKYYYNEEGQVFRSHAIHYTTKVPDKYSVDYTMLKL